MKSINTNTQRLTCNETLKIQQITYDSKSYTASATYVQNTLSLTYKFYIDPREVEFKDLANIYRHGAPPIHKFSTDCCRCHRTGLSIDQPHTRKGEEDASFPFESIDWQKGRQRKKHRSPSLAMYEHKGFIALLRFAYPRSSGSTGYRNEERRKTGTPKPVYYSKRGLVLRTRLSRRKKPAEPAYFLPGFIRGQATTDNTNRAFVGYQSCDVFVDEHCFRLMSLFLLFEFWKFRR